MDHTMLETLERIMIETPEDIIPVGEDDCDTPGFAASECFDVVPKGMTRALYHVTIKRL
jgi:hypothetical protein